MVELSRGELYGELYGELWSELCGELGVSCLVVSNPYSLSY